MHNQKYLNEPIIYTGTRLVDIDLNSTPPHTVLIGGHMGRLWYKGQPVVCNLCNVQDHKSATCPDKNKCPLSSLRLFARNCPDPWGTTPGGSLDRV